MDRRKFIQNSLLGWLTLEMFPIFRCKNSQQVIPKRRLGKHPEHLSVLGFGGIIVKDEGQQTANEAVATAVDRGVNYFDFAPTYGDAEERLGPALEPYRKKCFLACKTQQRLRENAKRELINSLKKLKTDYFDLYQLHAITTAEDVEKAFGPNGAMELFVKAKQEGKVRYLGFSAHSEKAALLAMKNYDFDTILFPINFVCWFEGNFGPRVVQRAKEKKMGILGLKSLAYTNLQDRANNPYPKCWYQPVEFNNDALMKSALRFTLSQSATAAIPPGQPEYFWKALNLISDMQSLNVEELQYLKDKSKGVAPIFKS